MYCMDMHRGVQLYRYSYSYVSMDSIDEVGTEDQTGKEDYP